MYFISDKEPILIDNTTLQGAKFALEMIPKNPSDWILETHAVNIRSLMDVLESIVLYGVLLHDSSSGGKYGILFKNDDIATKYLISEPFHQWDKGKFTSDVVSTSLAKLSIYLRQRAFYEDLHKFHRGLKHFGVPVFYRSPEEFETQLRKSFPSELSPNADIMLKIVSGNLRSADKVIANFAMFAFRGFYYQELAHMNSISYIPHTWRSSIIDRDTEQVSIDFTKDAVNEVSLIRRDLANALNAEFGAAAFGLDFPILASYIVNNCTHRNQLIPTALSIHNGSSARKFRKWALKIQANITDQKNLHAIYEAKSELNSLVNELRNEFGVSKKDEKQVVKIKFAIPIGSAALEIPTAFKVTKPIWLKTLINRRTHLVFLRKIAKASVDLIPFWQAYRQLDT